MFLLLLFLFIKPLPLSAQLTKCDQTPPHATVPEPSEDKGAFKLTIDNAENKDGHWYYTPSQTYVLTLSALNPKQPFRWFIITAEDPDVDNSIFSYKRKEVDVGTLKTLDIKKSRYSERCANSIENNDNSDKFRVEIHWVSPKQSDRVRIRAMVAENNEVWYNGESLSIVLEKDSTPSSDRPPILPTIKCNLCSEARYEIIFNGLWSRLVHPRHYPTKPDENGYSHMVGCSHDYNFTLWQQTSKATPGLRLLAEEANTSLIEREIINAMSPTRGTRTLIRGKRRHHPHMFKPSHSLFRVDNIHHLFSIAIALKPSPDWFLGTTKFELCTDQGWLKYFKLPLYPWDAGTMDGVSYESPKSMTQPVNNIERVEVGSFNVESPFYQMNLNDLMPFATLEVRRLDVYEWDSSECADNNVEDTQEEEPAQEDGPMIAESRQKQASCAVSEWGEWSPCVPDVGACGIGAQTRTRRERQYESANNDMQDRTSRDSCPETKNSDSIQLQHCFVEC